MGGAGGARLPPFPSLRLVGAPRRDVLYFFRIILRTFEQDGVRGGELLILDRQAEEGMIRHGEEGYPHEVCGLLVGHFEEGVATRTARDACRAVNLNRERSADRYDLDPADFRRIEEEARRRRMEIVGVYHSHPDHPSRPSETDRQGAEEIWQSGESWSYVILEVVGGSVASRRSWVLRGGAFGEEEIRVSPRAT